MNIRAENHSRKLLLKITSLCFILGHGSYGSANVTPDGTRSTITAAAAVSGTTATASASANPAHESLSQEMYEQRVSSAEELLGSHYRKSIVKTTESIPKINGSIYRWTKSSLPAKYKKDYQKIAQAIIDEAYRNEFDPVLLMAVIQSESSFKPTRLGHFGEIGLMQLKPSTAEWIAKKAGIPWKGRDSLMNPISNVRLGAAYLSYLRGRFDSHARLYLAAYNAGGANVRDAVERNIWPKDYPIHVMKNYVAYYTILHQQIN